MRDIDPERVSNRPGSRGRDERGFALVEAIIAGVVLLVGVVSMLGVFNDSRDLSATGERHEIAVLQAEQALEELRGIPYKNLVLNSGAVEPVGAGRLVAAGADFKVKPTLTERLVYYNTEGVPVTDAWVRPTSQVSIGVPGAASELKLDMTIHRFVTWRDEECRVGDLSGLGLNLPAAIDGTQVPLVNLINNVLGSVITLLSGTDQALVQTLKSRLQGLNDAFNAREAQLAAAIAGISELDLCDIDLATLEDLQQLGRLTPALAGAGKLTAQLQVLEGAFGGICLPIVGCLLGSSQKTAINNVNGQLDCMFGAAADTQPEFDAYLFGLLDGLNNLAGNLSNTDKNTKRITVAIVVEPRNGVGPFEPVWASSVVRNPAAGLLTSSGAPC